MILATGKPRVSDILFFVVLALIVIAEFKLIPQRPRFDDSYMFIRYADNLRQFGTYGWNPSEKTFGCTSIPYTFFIFFLRIMGLQKILNPAQFLFASAFFWLIPSLILLYNLVRKAVAGSIMEKPAVLKLVLLVIALNPFFIKIIFSGMDTSMSLFANCLMFSLVWRYKDNLNIKNLVLAATGTYFAYLVRPDNGLYCIVFPFVFLFYHRIAMKYILQFFVILGALLIIDTLLKYFYFGNPLPLPYFAKSGNFYKGYIGIFQWNNLLYMLNFLLAGGGVFLLLNALVLTPRSFRHGAFLLIPLALTMTYFIGVIQIMGYDSRYYIPSLPFLIIPLLMSLKIALKRKEKIRPIGYAYTILVALVFIAGYGYAAPDFINSRMEHARQEAKLYPLPPLPEVNNCKVYTYASAIWEMNSICKVFPAGTTIAATEHGYIGAYNPSINILDLCGLHNRELALQGWSPHFLKKANPEFIWMPHRDYVGLYSTIVHDPWFAEYDFYPGALLYGFAIKKNSPYFTKIRAILLKNNCRL